MTPTSETPATADASESSDADDPGSPEPDQPSPSLPAVLLNFMAEDVDPPLAGWLEVHLARIASLAQVHQGQLNVALVDDVQMIRWNRQYRNVDATTDVLSFDMRRQSGDPIEADIVICLDQAARQAEMRNHDTRLEVLLYAVHGLLHLIGYDDDDESRAQLMHEREDELLTQAGFAPVYQTKRSWP